jgi:penicillin-binding protein 1A
MRVLLRVFVIVLGVIVLLATVGLGWIFFYSRDLPDINALAEFAPSQVMLVSDPCLKTTSLAVPHDLIGNNLRAALQAAEGGEDSPGVLTQEYRGDLKSPRGNVLWLQIARSMFCEPSKTLNRELKELRTAVQLERRFSGPELFTIFANRAWFSKDLIGVEAASQHFFRKEPNQLQIGEAALLAGLLRAPSHFSPYEHPERALQRRNDVIDAMVQSRMITEAEGEAAKASVLGIGRS